MTEGGRVARPLHLFAQLEAGAAVLSLREWLRDRLAHGGRNAGP